MARREVVCATELEQQYAVAVKWGDGGRNLIEGILAKSNGDVFVNDSMRHTASRELAATRVASESSIADAHWSI
jgi:hypothetical protein